MLLSLVAFAVNGLVLLSDRAPGLLKRLSARVDAGVTRAAGAAGLDVPRGDVRVQRSDFDLHVAIWAVAALLVGLAAWSWMSLLLASGSVLAASVALEAAQAMFTASRSVQLLDVVGNFVGVLAGTCTVAAFAVLWRMTHPRTTPR